MNYRAVLRHPFRLTPSRRGQNGGQPSRLLPAERGCRGVIVKLSRGLGAEDPRAPFDHVEIQLQHAISPQNHDRHGRQRVLEGFSHRVSVGGEKKILDQLLRDGGGATSHFTGIRAILDDLPNLAPINAIVPVEVAVLSRDHRVLERRRDAMERHESLAFLVGSRCEEGLDATLNLDACGRGIDITERQQRRAPQGVQSNQKNYRTNDESLPKWALPAETGLGSSGLLQLGLQCTSMAQRREGLR